MTAVTDDQRGDQPDATSPASTDAKTRRVLVLEDDPTRLTLFRDVHPAATYVETAHDCISELSRQDWDDVCLDHDLGGEAFVDPRQDNTGSGVVRWILANRPPIRQVWVHSLNEGAAVAMVQALIDAGYTAERAPFLWLKEQSAIAPAPRDNGEDPE